MNKKDINKILGVRIKNYQSLEDINLEIGGLTLIKGESDIGKSAVVRGINGLLKNSIVKTQIQSNKNTTSVEIATKKGSVSIARSKSSSAKYEIRPVNGADVVHTKTGKIVPPEVFDLLGIHPHELDSDVSIITNVSPQFGGQFPIDQPSSVISKLLGRISNLNVVFSAIRLINAEDASKRAEQTALETIIGMKKRQINQFDKVPIQRQCLDILTAKAKEIDRLKDTVNSMTIILHDLQTIKQNLVTYKQQKFAGDILVVLSKKCEHLAGQTGAATKLLNAASNFKDAIEKERVALEGSTVLSSFFKKTVENVTLLKNALELFKDMSVIRVENNTHVRELKAELREKAKLKKEMDEFIDTQKLCPLISSEWRDGCLEIVKNG